jgi:hypothetical protein
MARRGGRKRGAVDRGLERLAALDAAELRAVVESVLAAHPHLAGDVARVTRAMAVGRSPEAQAGDAIIEAIAADLGDELNGLDVLDLTSPRHDPWDRRSDAEEAWDRLHQVVAPIVEAVVRLVALGRKTAAMQVLQGVLLALYTVREGEDTGELLQAAADFPTETAGWAWETWRRACGKGAALPEEFVRDRLPEWPWLLERRRAK